MKEKCSYRETLRSAGLIGGSSGINVLLGILRTKIFAMLIGPGGIGMIGVLQSIATFANALSGLGINRSGVRQIAESAGADDGRQISATIKAVRTMSLFLGLGGCLGLVLLSVPVSRLTFGDSSQWVAICVLGLVVLLTAVHDGQIALIQGLRRVGNLAQIRIVGALLGTAVGIPIVWYFRLEGLAWMLVGVGLMNLVASWWFARRVRVEKAEFDRKSISVEVRRLVRLGVSFMGAALVASATVYGIRLAIAHQTSMAELGQYTAAYAIAGIYVGFILNAMGSDFYPRLTAKASDPAACSHMVNEQVEIAMLLAVPGIIGGLTFAPYLMQVFYSGEFVEASRILRWQMLGLLAQVIAWPLGFVILAQGKGRLFFFSELLAHSVHLGLVLALVPLFGAKGAGMAFFGVYVVHLIFLLGVARKLIRFSWSAGVVRLMMWMVPATVLAFIVSTTGSSWVTVGVGAILCGFAGLGCVRGLLTRLGFESVFEVLGKIVPKKC